MRIACVLIHYLPVQVEKVHKNNLSNGALIIGGFPFEQKPVYDASPEAIVCGVKKGMPLNQAFVLCPEAHFLPSNEKLYWQVFEELIELLEQFSPTVEMEDLGCAYFDASSFESEPELADEVREAILRQTKLRACLGIADNKFIAKTGALVTKAGVPVIVAPGDEKDFIAPFSINFLPCSKRTKERLRFLGIQIMAQLAQISKESLKAQFKEGILLYELAHGMGNSTLKPRRKPKMAMEAVSFDNPVNTLEQVIPVIERAIDKIISNLKKQWQLYQKVNLRLTLSSNATIEKVFNLKKATNSPQTILLRLKPWLAEVNLPGQVNGIEISLELTGDKGAQPNLWGRKRKTETEVNSLAQILQQKFGYQPLKKAVTMDPDALLPENRFKLIDVK